MKKKAILLLLCVAVLSGCGPVDSIDIDSQITPVEVEQTTDENGEEIELVPRTTAASDSTETTASASDSVTTTTKSGAVSLVKRTNITKKTLATNRTTVRIPSNSKTTAKSTTTGTGTSTGTGTGTGTGTVTGSGTATGTGTETTTITGSTVSTTSGVTSTTVDNQNSIKVTRDDVSCEITENGVNVTVKGNTVPNVSFIDTSFMLNAAKDGKTDPKYSINIIDADFDGNYDLFIPLSEDEFNVYGKFVHYNPNTLQFEEWPLLEYVTTYNTSSQVDRTIVSVVYKSENEYEQTTRQWILNEEINDWELRKIAKKEQYIDTESNQVYIKYWKYIDNVETPDKREKVTLDENGEVISREDVTWA